MNKNLNHVMIDIETLGTTGRSVILSIAAVQFCIATGEIGKTFKMNVSVKSCLQAGLVVDEDCLKWWMTQSDDAKRAVFESPMPLKDVLFEFGAFIKDLGENVELWGNGSSFDLALLRDAYAAINEAKPWKHWSERDVRTVVRYFPKIKAEMEADFIGTKHEPLADCYHQIKYLTTINQRIISNF